MLTAFQYRMHVRRPSIASTAAQEREGRAQDWQTAPPVGQKKPEAAECAWLAVNHLCWNVLPCRLQNVSSRSSHLTWCTTLAIRFCSSPKSCNHNLHLVQHSEGSTPRDLPCLVLLPYVKARDPKMKQLLDSPFASQKSPWTPGQPSKSAVELPLQCLKLHCAFKWWAKVNAGRQAGGQTHQSVVIRIEPYQECADLWDSNSGPPASSSGMCGSRDTYHISESTLFYVFTLEHFLHVVYCNISPISNKYSKCGLSHMVVFAFASP